MDLSSLIVFLLVGAIAGWLAGQIMSGRGFGLIGNMVVGIVGAFLGGWLLTSMGVSLGVSGLAGVLLQALLGAIVLLAIVGLIKRA
ncbi:MAG: GlsB/YeaQ/YmgE family stress response membrane protein [Thermoanaerobaculia bacterium]|nr:GlsB/YeaQ/YmgE family stress response membrane protein [Thermoanaerobaculia bacterium]